jgi:hypothetical protein
LACGGSERAGNRAQPGQPAEPYTREFGEESWEEFEPGSYLLSIPVRVHRRGFRPSIKLYKKSGDEYEVVLSEDTTEPKTSVSITTKARFAGKIVIV